MADFPAMPIWTDAYLADTMHLDAMESGAYLHLLMAAWRTPDCSLPNDDKILARYAKCQPRQWKRIKETVLAFWDIGENQKWTQKRLLRERNWVQQKSDRASQAAKAKWLKDNDTGNADASPEHMPDACSNDAPTPIPISKDKKEKTNKKEKPDFEDWWAAYPRKVAKGAALKAYRAARKKTDAETLLEAVKRFAEQMAGKEAEFIPHAATWLNAERWLDEAAPKPKPPDPDAPLLRIAPLWQRIFEKSGKGYTPKPERHEVNRAFTLGVISEGCAKANGLEVQ